jgi:hypothetical protein
MSKKQKREKKKAKKVFKEGFIPPSEQMPRERSHERAKLVYRVVMALTVYYPKRREAGLREIRDVNPILHDRVRQALSLITPADIQFVKGPRPMMHDDGKLAIYHPQDDNPILQAVLRNESPSFSPEEILQTGRRLWTPPS